jgi:hypothetical protein
VPLRFDLYRKLLGGGEGRAAEERRMRRKMGFVLGRVGREQWRERRRRKGRIMRGGELATRRGGGEKKK